MKAANKRSTASRRRRATNIKCFYELPWRVDERKVTPASREKLRRRDFPLMFPREAEQLEKEADFEATTRRGLYGVLAHPGKDLVKRVCNDRQFALYVALLLDILPAYRSIQDMHVTRFLIGQHALQAALSFRKDARDVMAEARRPAQIAPAAQQPAIAKAA